MNCMAQLIYTPNIILNYGKKMQNNHDSFRDLFYFFLRYKAVYGTSTVQTYNYKRSDYRPQVLIDDR